MAIHQQISGSEPSTELVEYTPTTLPVRMAEAVESATVSIQNEKINVVEDADGAFGNKSREEVDALAVRLLKGIGSSENGNGVQMIALSSPPAEEDLLNSDPNNTFDAQPEPQSSPIITSSVIPSSPAERAPNAVPTFDPGSSEDGDDRSSTPTFDDYQTRLDRMGSHLETRMSCVLEEKLSEFMFRSRQVDLLQQKPWSLEDAAIYRGKHIVEFFHNAICCSTLQMKICDDELDKSVDIDLAPMTHLYREELVRMRCCAQSRQSALLTELQNQSTDPALSKDVIDYLTNLPTAIMSRRSQPIKGGSYTHERLTDKVPNIENEMEASDGRPFKRQRVD
jgi:hypothetical protein